MNGIWWLLLIAMAVSSLIESLSEAARRLWGRRLTKHELSYLFSRRNLSHLIAKWYGHDFDQLRCKMYCECNGLRHKVSKVSFEYDGVLGLSLYCGSGKSLFHKVAEYRAFADAVMEDRAMPLKNEGMN